MQSKSRGDPTFVITVTSAVTFSQSASAGSVSETREKRICTGRRIFNRDLNKKVTSTELSERRLRVRVIHSTTKHFLMLHITRAKDPR